MSRLSVYGENDRVNGYENLNYVRCSLAPCYVSYLPSYVCFGGSASNWRLRFIAKSISLGVLRSSMRRKERGRVCYVALLQVGTDLTRATLALPLLSEAPSFFAGDGLVVIPLELG
jgi:hypothetical protein